MRLSGVILIVVFSVIVCVPLAAIIVIGIHDNVESKVFQQEVLKTSLQLVLIGVLGMFARELLQSYSAQKAEEQRAVDDARLKRTQDHNDRVSALNQLTQAYWGVKKCLHIIHGHRSALSYKEQMHLIIDHRLQLQKLHNEIEADMYALNEKKNIGNALSRLDQRLEKLIDEWTDKHLDLAWQQKNDEKATSPGERKVPSMIGTLPELKAVWDNIDLIHRPFVDAATSIRCQILSRQAASKNNGFERTR